MTIFSKAVLKSCVVTGAVLALSACKTMSNDHDMDQMSHGSMDHMMSTMLTGAAEVPEPGDANGKGHFDYTINMNTNMLCYKLSVEGIEAPTAAHIHDGAAGVAGGVVVMLQAPTLGRVTDTCMSIDPSLATRLTASPTDFYVNVHNAGYPNGALRGQLTAMMHNM